ncbi:MAG: mannose-1-phosphate guanylyltransferase/mannose-6-phosphate isomerase [Candidatus Eutrophobiaceae bacterium]
MERRIRPIILAGGDGTRLWPMSRRHRPKQFVSLFGKDSLLQHTLRRLQGIDDALPPLILCSEEHRFLALEHLAALGIEPERIILEPAVRNTAPSMTVAAHYQMQTGEDALLLMLPSDQYIGNASVFQRAAQEARRVAMEEWLCLFGIPPISAETAYGYIHCGAKLKGDAGAMQVRQFTEKPNAETARAYLEHGGYLWNSGIVMISAERWLRELRGRDASMLESCKQALCTGEVDGKFLRLERQSFESCNSVSVDYAVLEPAANDAGMVAVLPVSDLAWSDAGTWQSVWELSERDSNGNATHGDVVSQDAHDCLLNAGHRLLAVQGCRDLVVVETADAVLVADRKDSEGVRKIVAGLREQRRSEVDQNPRVLRPWGYYESLLSNPGGYQVKRLSVKPGMRISLQYHRERSEHWVVIRGTATVTRGKELFELGENESTYIPIGMEHRLANNTDQPLELIEIQLGAYLGEDDIVRLQDDFNRI